MTTFDALQKKIRDILLADWNPVGVGGVAAAQDEYDGYVGSVARMVRERKSADDIAKRLLEI